MANVVSIERLDERTRVEHLDNGTDTVIIQEGQHYFDRDAGAYLDCDSTILADEAVPGFSHNVKAGSARARLADGGKFRFGLRHPLYVTYAPRGAAAVAAAVADNRATFPGLWPGVDVELEKAPEWVKETLVLADASAPASYTWDLEELVGVVPTLEADGSLAYVETITGQVIGGIPAPTVHDASGNPGTVTMTYADGAITTAIDPAWLADPARVWPVTLDPTTLTLQPDSSGMDATLDSVYPDSNYGTDTYVEIGVDGSALFDFVQQFNLSGVGRSHITSASLQLKHYATNGTYTAGQTRTGDVKRISGAAWNEGTVTWNNCPAVNATIRASATFAVDAFPQWVSWDITALVNEWLGGTYLNYGLRMTSSAGNGAPKFYSSDWTTAADRPKLVITMTVIPSVSTTSPTGTSATPGTVTNDVTPALSGVYSSTDAVNMAKKRHQVYDAANNLVWDSGEVAQSAAPGAAVSATVPAGLLKYGQTYSWRWMAIDANGAYSSWSALTYFQSVMSAPTGLFTGAAAGEAAVNLGWNAHAGENLAGYKVYRRKAGATDWVLFSLNNAATTDTTDYSYFLTPDQVSLITVNSYQDNIPVSGQGYEYAVTAVATDGYESPKSAAAAGSVTYATNWVDDVQLQDPAITDQALPFQGTIVPVHGKTAPVIFGRRTSRRRTLAGTALNTAAMEALEAALAPGSIHRYADPAAAFRFVVAGDLRAPRTYPVTDADGQTVEQFDWSVDVVEVG